MKPYDPNARLLKQALWLAAVMAVISAAWCGGYASGHKSSTVVRRYETIEELARRQPDILKANLLVVAGTHASGADFELADILQSFAEKLFDRLIETNIDARTAWTHSKHTNGEPPRLRWK